MTPTANAIRLRSVANAIINGRDLPAVDRILAAGVLRDAADLDNERYRADMDIRKAAREVVLMDGLDIVIRKALAERDTNYEQCFQRDDMGSMRRLPNLVNARAHAWRMARDAGYSYPEIARACGMKSHSTIVGAMQKMQQELNQSQTEAA